MGGQERNPIGPGDRCADRRAGRNARYRRPYPQAGDPLPPLWHWLYFLPFPQAVGTWPGRSCEARGLSASGGVAAAHVGRRARSNFIVRCVWAKRITRTSRIVDVQSEGGSQRPAGIRSGAARDRRRRGNRADGGARYCLSRSIRGPRIRSVRRRLLLSDAAWERVVQPDDVLLFRYSALTFNGHRIHYDRRYATEVERLSGAGGAWPADRHAAGGSGAAESAGAAVGRALRVSGREPDFRHRGVFGLRKARRRWEDHPLWAKDAAGCLATTATAMRI